MNSKQEYQLEEEEEKSDPGIKQDEKQVECMDQRYVLGEYSFFAPSRYIPWDTFYLVLRQYPYYYNQIPENSDQEKIQNHFWNRSIKY